MTATRKTARTTKATAPALLAAWNFPKRSDFFFDFPKAAEFTGPGLAACPKCRSTELYEGEINAKGFVTNEDKVGGCHHCGFHWDLRLLPKVPRANSAGVAASWSNPEVKAARTTKHGVTVKAGGKTTDHKSVAAAFRALNLPMAKHIQFRGKLKASGKEIFEHNGVMHAFRLVEND
jgi:hypothetical protein